MSAQTDPAPSPQVRLGIRGTLAAAFAAVAALAVAASGTAWLAFGAIEPRLIEMTSGIMPSMISAQTITAQAARVVAATARLDDVTSDAERLSLVGALGSLAFDLAMELDQLSAEGIDPATTVAMRDQVTALNRNLSRENTLVSRRIALEADLARHKGQLAEDHRLFLEVVTPRIDSSYRFLYRSSRSLLNTLELAMADAVASRDRNEANPGAEESATRTMRLAVGDLINTGVHEMRTLLELASASNLAVGLLLQASDSVALPALQGLRERFSRISANMGMIRLNLPDTTDNQELNRRVRPLLEAGLGAANLFDLRSEMIGVIASIEALVEENRQLSNRLSLSAAAVAAAARTAANDAKSEAEAALWLARALLIGTGLVATVTALLIAWLYVGRNLVARLLDLERCMRAEASGVATVIPTAGHDEISAMGVALASLVNERTRREQALDKSGQRLALALKATRSGVWDSDWRGRRSWWSDEFYALLGYAPGDPPASYQTLLALMHPDDREPLHRALHAVVDSDAAHGAFLYRLKHRDGSWLWVEAQCALIRDDRGQVLRMVGVATDVTRRKLAEESLQAAKEAAEQADAAKTRFLAAASHDLRQPLQAITLFNSTLADVTRDPQQLYIIGKTQQSLDALNEMLNVILDISRLDAGTVKPEPVAFALQTVFDRLAGEFRPLAARAGLGFRVVPCSVVAFSDPRLVERIVRNLVANALRYTRHGRILLGARRQGAAVRIEVWDTGRGISPEQQERIFEEFYQVGNQERDRGKGLGLGLSICRRMAELLGLPLGVRSELGRGSGFSLTVPFNHQPLLASLPAGGEATAPLHGSGVIAVIDDDTAVLEALAGYLRRYGYQVTAAPDADGALQLLRLLGQPPQLVVADWRLADGATGAQAIGRIRDQIAPTVPGIIMTGDTSPDRLEQVAATGFRLLHKPVRPQDLLAAIQAELAARG